MNNVRGEKHNFLTGVADLMSLHILVMAVILISMPISSFIPFFNFKSFY